jgi:hypothetical protein
MVKHAGSASLGLSVAAPVGATNTIGLPRYIRKISAAKIITIIYQANP